MSIERHSWVKKVFYAGMLGIFWLMVLPFSFHSYTTVCTHGMTNCDLIATHQWAWLGGYHIFVEHIFFFNSSDSLYLGFTYPGAGLLVANSVILGYLSYLLLNLVVKRRTSNE